MMAFRIPNQEKMLAIKKEDTTEEQFVLVEIASTNFET